MPCYWVCVKLLILVVPSVFLYVAKFRMFCVIQETEEYEVSECDKIIFI